MNTVTEDVKDYLVAQAIGTFGDGTGWRIFIAAEPSSPDTIITLYDTPGPKPGYCFNKAVKPMRFDNIGIRVRGLTYKTARAKMDEIVDALNKRGAFSVGTVRYSDIQMVGDVFPIGRDDKDRPVWSSNWQAFRVDSSSY